MVLAGVGFAVYHVGWQSNLQWRRPRVRTHPQPTRHQLTMLRISVMPKSSLAQSPATFKQRCHSTLKTWNVSVAILLPNYASEYHLFPVPLTIITPRCCGDRARSCFWGGTFYFIFKKESHYGLFNLYPFRAKTQTFSSWP